MPCDCTRSFIGNKITEIEHRIADLAELQSRFRRILKTKRRDVCKSICPIITDSEKTS
jgi:hypothetical protein